LGSSSVSFLRLLLDAKKAVEKGQDTTTVAVQEKENLKHTPALWITFGLEDEIRHVSVFYKRRRLSMRSD
jgi:hypothetical protein